MIDVMLSYNTMMILSSFFADYKSTLVDCCKRLYVSTLYIKGEDFL